jgi:hypothetical protein
MNNELTRIDFEGGFLCPQTNAKNYAGQGKIVFLQVYVVGWQNFSVSVLFGSG